MLLKVKINLARLIVYFSHWYRWYGISLRSSNFVLSVFRLFMIWLCFGWLCFHEIFNSFIWLKTVTRWRIHHHQLTAWAFMNEITVNCYCPCFWYNNEIELSYIGGTNPKPFTWNLLWLLNYLSNLKVFCQLTGIISMDGMGTLLTLCFLVL